MAFESQSEDNLTEYAFMAESAAHQQGPWTGTEGAGAGYTGQAGGRDCMLVKFDENL